MEAACAENRRWLSSDSSGDSAICRSFSNSMRFVSSKSWRLSVAFMRLEEFCQSHARMQSKVSREEFANHLPHIRPQSLPSRLFQFRRTRRSGWIAKHLDDFAQIALSGP